MKVIQEGNPVGLVYSCAICTEWVPVASAVSCREGARERHFCSNTCHEQWNERKLKNIESAREKDDVAS